MASARRATMLSAREIVALLAMLPSARMRSAFIRLIKAQVEVFHLAGVTDEFLAKVEKSVRRRWGRRSAGRRAGATVRA